MEDGRKPVFGSFHTDEHLRYTEVVVRAQTTGPELHCESCSCNCRVSQKLPWNTSCPFLASIFRRQDLQFSKLDSGRSAVIYLSCFVLGQYAYSNFIVKTGLLSISAHHYYSSILV